MILSDKTIREYLSSGRIKVLPDVRPADIRPVGIRLHLASEILIPKADQIVDLSSDQEIVYDRVVLEEEGYVLKPNEFVLGSTVEKFQVPRNIVGHIEGRSTVARIGLSIHCTSGIIDGNFDEPRTVVFEIKNNGPMSIVLKSNLALGMLVFTELSVPIEQNSQAQYKGQDGVEPPNLKLQKQ